jgi:hypothetical protein
VVGDEPTLHVEYVFLNLVWAFLIEIVQQEIQLHPNLVASNGCYGNELLEVAMTAITEDDVHTFY